VLVRTFDLNTLASRSGSFSTLHVSLNDIVPHAVVV
jgi:hypothetical protein